jgi:hypothetical protein
MRFERFMPNSGSFKYQPTIHARDEVCDFYSIEEVVVAFVMTKAVEISCLFDFKEQDLVKAD